MKKIIVATFLFVALATASFAGGNKAGEELLSNLSKSLQQSSSVQWSTNESFSKGSFSFNGKKATAYYTIDENTLAGFTVDLSVSDISAQAADFIGKKYAGWTVNRHIMFISNTGETGYFAEVSNGKKTLALKITPKGKAFIVAHIY
ncbi:MAG TPA: hypothetical protein PL045_11210 [Chitinophagaceae bacterium]|nr:hypothetical protein [Chitinophagaceae bacterium]